ncbi:MAG: glycosyltransferase family 4 protein [Steroidobacterales bacterium]
MSVGLIAGSQRVAGSGQRRSPSPASGNAHEPLGRESGDELPGSIVPSCRTVLMVGTDLRGMGGVRAVVKGYMDGGLFERVDCTYAATHRYGPPWVKVWAALTGWARVAKLLLTLERPLVHVHLSAHASFWRKSIVCLMARLAGRPYLLHLHSGFFPEFYEQSGPLARRLIRGTFADAAVVIALSEQWRSWLFRICASARIEVLANAVALPDLGRQRQLQAAESKLLFLGDISRSKGVFDLVQAFARVSAEFPHLKLICGGVGAVEELCRLRGELGVDRERLCCPGWLETERARSALAGATIFVLPSHAEALPMALLEAMSWSLPVITTPVGGIPQVIENEVNGLLVVPGDIDAIAAAIARLMREPALRAKLGGAARRTIEQSYSLDAAVERLIQIYRRFGIEPQPPRDAGAADH